MNGIKISPQDQEFQLAEVLTALAPMFAESLFYVGDFEPGWWTSPEARAWVTLLLDVEARTIPGVEPLLLSYANVMYFAKSSRGMNDYEIRMARTPGDLDRNTWAGYISSFGQFEVCFQEMALVEEAGRLLRGAGYSTAPMVPAPLHHIAVLNRVKPNLRERMIHLLADWDAGETKDSSPS